MYSSIETPSTSSSQNHQIAFNTHPTANVKSTTASLIAPKANKACGKSIITSSLSLSSSAIASATTLATTSTTGVSIKPPPPTFTSYDNNNKNQFTYGAYINNNNNNNRITTSNINNTNYSSKLSSTSFRTATAINAKIIPRGPYLQYKMNEEDNKSNQRRYQNYYPPSIQPSTSMDNVESLKNDFIGYGVLPRAKINTNNYSSSPVLDTLVVDNNLKTQTICRYQQQLNNQIHTKHNPTLMNSQHDITSQHQHQHQLQQHQQQQQQKHYLHSNKPQSTVTNHIAFNSHTLPISRKENAQKSTEMFINTMTQQKHRPPAPLPSQQQNHINYIALRNALNVKAMHQLNPTQGWALLCQSVQALQDLFLSDAPSINRVLPVVTPNNLYISSRGRVVFGLLTVDKYTKDMEEYLSDEFRQFIAGKQVKFTESDIEKMWIYSLGRTLTETMPTSSSKSTINSPITENSIHHQQQQHHSSIVLQATIWKMCNRELEERASLMLLLNLISDYCKNFHQSKPFSHIVMDLFKRVIVDPNYSHQKDPPKNEKQESNIRIKMNLNKHLVEDHKSDTDSGRSSDYRSDDNSLHSKKLPSMPEENKFFSLPRPKYTSIPEKIQLVAPVPMEAKVKRKMDNYRQKRVGGRRFTVDVSANDISNAISQNEKRKVISRSSNHLNVVMEGDEMKLRTLPNMKLAKKVEIDEDDEVRPKGPEFIVNATSEAKVLDISDSKCISRRNVNVLLLNGMKYNIICNPITTTTRMVFEAIIKSERIHENYFLGLCALVGGDFVFLSADLKIYKVAPQIWIQSATKKHSDIERTNCVFSLFLRIKFYLPTLRVSSVESRHFLYLQLRKSVLENQIVCTDDDLITLGGLALQAEVGDFKENMKYIEYFTITHYLPDVVYQQNKELAKYLRNSHYSKRGLHQKEAEYNFIRYLQEMREYGVHYISGVWARDDKIELNCYIGIGLNGIKIFERSNHTTNQASRSKDKKKCTKRLLYEEFDWLEIENICFSKQVLCVVVRKSNLRLNLGAKDKSSRLKFKLKMDSRKSYFAFTIASEHHQFYMKLRNSFVSIKSIAEELNYQLPDESETAKTELNMKIDKPTKSTGIRVRNLKKSMLNDNKLLKLKEKFIRRSKSTVCEFKSSMEEKDTNENNQNKENERPKYPSLFDLSIKSPTVTRNKVKMGTRVFSASYLNKSFDSLTDSPLELARVDSWGALCLKQQPEEEIDEMPEASEKPAVYYEQKISSSQNCEDAYIIHSSIKSINHGNNNYSMANETMTESLLEKFENISCTDDRVLSQIILIKDPVFSNKHNIKSQSLRNLTSYNVDNFITGYTMGISIIQGNADNYVYVKELVKNGPGDRNGIRVGDQVVSVDGISLLNLPYTEALGILQSTGSEVTLIVSQIYTRKPMKDWNNEEAIMVTPVKEKPLKYVEIPNNLMSTPSKSLPNLLNSKNFQLPKIVAIIPKENAPARILAELYKEHPIGPKKPARAFGQSRKYNGPTKFPVTPGKKEPKDVKLTISPSSHKTHLSLPSNDSDNYLL